MARKAIPQFYRNRRGLTDREIAILKTLERRPLQAATRRWSVWRDDVDRVVVGRPVGGGHDTYYAPELRA